MPGSRLAGLIATAANSLVNHRPTWNRRTLASYAAMLCLMCFGAAVVPQVASAQPLTGETLQSGLPGNVVYPSPPTCNSDQSGSWSYSATGQAAGPYIGTYTETGTVTVNSDRTISAQANFQIFSPSGTVTGSKSVSNAGSGFCVQGDVFPGGGATITSVGGIATMTYTASTPDCTDHGSSQFTYTSLPAGTAGVPGEVGTSFLNESFVSQSSCTPTSKEQCKDGGWRNFPQFKNQGQCVAAVEHATNDGGS